MSLSGLDTPAVDGAYNTFLEKGGWLALLTHPPPALTSYRFLLYYTARDVVDVLSQGVKGIAEMRQAAEAHCNNDGPPPTPLFGMIHFRRRKLLVKLVLEGASRLIKGSLIRRQSLSDRRSALSSALELRHLAIPRSRLDLRNISPGSADGECPHREHGAAFQ